MKKMKKIMATLLAAIMTLAMAVTAFAADTNTTGKGTLTVNVKGGQTLAGQTVNIYKLFDITTDGNSDYGYKVNSDYASILDAVLSVTDKSDQGYYEAVQNATGTDTQKFANDFTKKLLDYNKTASTKISATETKTFGANATDTTFDVANLDYGYYLVCQTGTKSIQSSLVAITGATATVDLKSEAPSIDKTTEAGKKLDSVQIGDTITYKITGTIPDRTGYATYVYKIHDELSTGLDFVGNTASVKIGDADAVNETMTFDTDNARKMTLDLSKYVTEDNVNAGKTVTVTYQAKVNSTANVGTQNNAQLEYSNNPSDENGHTTTPPSVVETPTYPLNIKKTNANGDTILAGAKFRLYTTEADAKADTQNNMVKVTATGTEGKYTVAEDQTTGTAIDMISVNAVFSKTDSYNLQLNGLKAGTYYLVETEAPEGYNKLSAPVTIVIADTTDSTNVEKWTISQNGTNADDKIIDIENSTGSLLPSTGGRGAIAFGVIAAALVLGVVVSFMRDKRKASL